MRKRQWLTLCSICFFDVKRIFLRTGSEEKVEIFRKLILEDDARVMVSAVLAW